MKYSIQDLFIFCVLIISPILGLAQIDSNSLHEVPNSLDDMVDHPDYKILPFISYQSWDGSQTIRKSTLTKAQFRKLLLITRKESRQKDQFISRIDTLIWLNSRSGQEEVGIYANELTPNEIKIIVAE